MVKLGSKKFERLPTHKHWPKHWYKIYRLDTKLVDGLQGSKILIFYIILPK